LDAVKCCETLGIRHGISVARPAWVHRVARAVALAVAIGFALGVFAPCPAAADGVYFTEGLGGTAIRDELSTHAGSALRIRGALGVRRKQLAIELWGAALVTDRHPSRDRHEDGTRVVGRTSDGNASTRGPSYDIGTWGIDAKLIQPLAPSVELYLRGGLSRGYAAAIDASGRGVGISAGVQVKGKVSALGLLFWPLLFSGGGPRITAAAYLETGYELYRLHGPRQSTDAQLNHLLLGFAIGSDF
jgi:hypothetical protein